jgi:hypothetical protein
MKTYKENDLVIYTDSEGNRFDTFVIFDTDIKTGLTHINHFNLKVKATELVMHPRSAKVGAIPLADPLSFNLFKQLKEKYTERDAAKKTSKALILYTNNTRGVLAKAS